MESRPPCDFLNSLRVKRASLSTLSLEDFTASVKLFSQLERVL